MGTVKVLSSMLVISLLCLIGLRMRPSLAASLPPRGANVIPPGGARSPPAPLAIRTRTRKLRDINTGLPRPRPKEADVSLDLFQRTFPEVRTEEHILIQRWEDLRDLFGSVELAHQLVEDEPSILRWPRKMPRRAFHYYAMYLGPEVARDVVIECPFLLTKRAGQTRETLPALLNVLGSKQRLQEIAVEYPMLMHVPIGDFYRGMANMIAVSGNPQAAMNVAREAMDRLAKSPYRSIVPDCYPVLIAIFGGLDEAHAAIDREPMLLKWYGEQFLGTLGRLRELLGKEITQEVVKKAPYLLLPEGRNAKKVDLAFKAMERLFGTEETRRRIREQPDLLSLGWNMDRALRFAERKLGSVIAVRDNFEKVLRRTGLIEHLSWETKPRPRHGYWTPKTRLPRGYPPVHGPWSPHSNPLGYSGPLSGRWDDDDSDVREGFEFEEAELVPKSEEVL